MGRNGLGSRIKDARLQSGLSQTEVAEKVGASQALVSLWELGKNEPKPDFRKKLEVVLGLDSKNSKNGNSADIEELSAIGAWLNHQRTNKRLTVAELSKSSGVAIPTIYAIESGRISNCRRAVQNRPGVGTSK